MRRRCGRVMLMGLLALVVALVGLVGPLGGGEVARAAPVAVPCDVAQLRAAIGNAANDVLNLAAGRTYTLTAVDNTTDGPNGLPSIGRTLRINGNGAIVERSSVGGTPLFRLFHIAAGGNLTLDQLTVRNGRTPDGASVGGSTRAARSR